MIDQSDIVALAGRLNALGREIAAFKEMHDNAHAAAIVALEAKLERLRQQISDDIDRRALAHAA